MTTLTSDNAHNPVADGEKVLGPNDNAYQDPTHRAPLVVGKHNFTTITRSKPCPAPQKVTKPMCR